MSQYVPTRYKVLCIIDKRCRVRNYVREVRWYIYTSLRGQVCAHVIATLSHNNAQVSAVTTTLKAASSEVISIEVSLETSIIVISFAPTSIYTVCPVLV